MFAPLYRDVAGSDAAVEVRYRPSWHGLTVPGQAVDRLAGQRERDLALGATTSGPHRDSFFYSLEGKDFTQYASTGQLRLCALVLRVAQARFLSERTGRRPVLLLDDVLLELDPGRKRQFVSQLPAYEQAFFTFLPDESWQAFRGEETRVFTVANGRLFRMKRVGDLLRQFLEDRGWSSGDPYSPLFAGWKRVVGEAAGRALPARGGGGRGPDRGCRAPGVAADAHLAEAGRSWRRPAGRPRRPGSRACGPGSAVDTTAHNSYIDRNIPVDKTPGLPG